MRNVLDEIQEIFRDVLDNDDIVLAATTTAADVKGWDSLVNVKLMVRIEKHFGIKFKTGEVVGLKNVGELVELTKSRTPA